MIRSVNRAKERGFTWGWLRGKARLLFVARARERVVITQRLNMTTLQVGLCVRVLKECMRLIRAFVLEKETGTNYQTSAARIMKTGWRMVRLLLEQKIGDTRVLAGGISQLIIPKSLNGKSVWGVVYFLVVSISSIKMNVGLDGMQNMHPNKKDE